MRKEVVRKAESQPSQELDIRKIMEDFHKEEGSSSRRKGTFKIDKLFEEALDTILRTRGQSGGSKRLTAKRG